MAPEGRHIMALLTRRNSHREKDMTTTTITELRDPAGLSVDPLTDLLRSGAQQLIQQAVEAELSTLLENYSSERTEEGRARLVRHGHLPEREVMTMARQAIWQSQVCREGGIGAVPVKVARVRYRGCEVEKVRFTSSILPPICARPNL